MNSKMNNEYIQINKIGLRNGWKRVTDASGVSGLHPSILSRQKDLVETEICIRTSSNISS